MANAGRDLAFSLSMLAVGVAVLLESRNIPPPLFETFGAALVPQATAGLLILVALIILLRSLAALRRRASTGSAMLTMPELDLRLAGTIAILYAHAVAISYMAVSFLVATITALLFLFVLLGGARPRFLALSVVLSIVVSGSLLLVFTRIFHIDLP